MYIFYPDVYFFSQFVTAMYAIAIISCIYKIPVKKKRIFFTGVIFGIVSTIMVICVNPFRLYSLLVHISVIPGTVFLACKPSTGREFVREIVASYVAIWMLYGCVEWVTNQTGWSGNILLCSCAVFIYLVVFLANQVRIRLNQQIPVILCHKGKKLSLTGFCDTGNVLMDPYSGKPVHVVNFEALEPLLKEAEEENYRWIPYKTVSGNELMRSYTIDEMILCRKKPMVLKKVVVGVSKTAFFQGESIQLLLNVSQLNL